MILVADTLLRWIVRGNDSIRSFYDATSTVTTLAPGHLIDTRLD